MQRLAGPAVWKTADAAASNAWRVALSEPQARALAEEARRVVAAGKVPELVGQAEFRAEQCAELLAAIHEELEHGIGFTLLSGLPLDDLSYAEQVALTCGISDLVGRVVVQNYEGQRIVDVKDEGIAYSHQSRGYRSNKYLPFHTDGAHLFSLTCLGEAVRGGETLIASASAVYNTLVDEYPEALELLARGYFHHRRGQHDPGESPLSPERVPVFTFHDGLLHCCYNRNPIEWAEKEGVRLSAPERSALDAIDEVLSREEIQLPLRMRCGESLLVNNFVTLHSRNEYQDDAAHHRHMLRVWMRDPASRRNGVNLLDLYVPERFRP